MQISPPPEVIWEHILKTYTDMGFWALLAYSIRSQNHSNDYRNIVRADQRILEQEKKIWIENYIWTEQTALFEKQLSDAKNELSTAFE